MKECIPILLLSIFSISCSDDEPSLIDLRGTEQSTYNSPSFEINAFQELSLVNELAILTSEIQKGREGNPLNESQLDSIYSLSLKDITQTDYSNLIENKFIPEATASSAKVYVLTDSITTGGVYVGYLFNQNGLEPQQMIEKGLFGSALYYQASKILSDDMSLLDLDRVLVLFGSNPEFPNTDNSESTSYPDKLLAKYGARRDKLDGNGYYSKIKSDFIFLKNLLEANNSSNKEEINTYISLLKIHWEKINAATIVNYLYEVQSILSETNLTNADRAAALHSYSEVIAFLYGWKGIPETDKLISNTDLTTILEILKIPENGDEESYQFALNPAENLSVIEANILPLLQKVYDFTDDEMEDFKSNWVSKQNR